MQFGGDDDRAIVAGIVATSAAYTQMDLDHEGHVLFSERDERGRMAWPTGAALRSYIDLDAKDAEPRPYVLLSGAILQQAQLPFLDGYAPTREAIETPFDERVAEVQRAPTAYTPHDPLASKILFVALGLVGVMALVVLGIFAPQFAVIVGETEISMMTVGIILAVPVLAFVGWLFYSRRDGSKDVAAATPAADGDGDGS